MTTCIKRKTFARSNRLVGDIVLLRQILGDGSFEGVSGGCVWSELDVEVGGGFGRGDYGYI